MYGPLTQVEGHGWACPLDSAVWKHKTSMFQGQLGPTVMDPAQIVVLTRAELEMVIVQGCPTRWRYSRRRHHLRPGGCVIRRAVEHQLIFGTRRRTSSACVLHSMKEYPVDKLVAWLPLLWRYNRSKLELGFPSEVGSRIVPRHCISAFSRRSS
jgi:hypothetical protein